MTGEEISGLFTNPVKKQDSYYGSDTSSSLLTAKRARNEARFTSRFSPGASAYEK
jgi:hypothetical protein